jgi:CubicO group peptidase (beta-lactamase class C family)
MRRFFCLTLAILLMAALLVPVAAVRAQHEGVFAVTQAVQRSVGTDAPGAAVVLFENGERILYEGYGYSNVSARKLVTVETGFEIGELSSLFVVLAVQKLAGEGALELDRDVAYYLPADFMKRLNLSYEITVQDLLMGRASFAERYFDLRYENPTLTFDGLESALLADVPAQVAPPGTFSAYSPFGIALAAFLVECVSGTDYATYVDEQILAPLGMTSTVLAPHTGEIAKMAVGHVTKGAGSFAVAKKNGRTYSALWPADGAVSTAADLSLLLEYLLNGQDGMQILESCVESGIFQSGAAGFAVSGALRARSAETPYFTASLCLDLASANAVLVLCNNKEASLLSLPYEYCGFREGAQEIAVGGVMPDPVQFEGEYILRRKNGSTLHARTVKNVQVSVDDEGVLSLNDRRLVQIAPGVFADPAESEVAVVQFLTDTEGTVSGLILADGESYRPAEWTERDGIATACFVLLTVGAIYFLIGGVLALVDAMLTRARGDRHPRAWRFTLPWVLAAVNCLIVLVQILVCRGFGGATIASFLTASSTISLFFVIGAVCGFVYALFTGFTTRRMTGRVARSAILYVLFLMLCGYWDIILF